MLNLNKHTETKPKPTVIFKNCSYVCVSLCTTVIHNTAQNSSDNFPSYPPDNHHSSDDVYWRGGGKENLQKCLLKLMRRKGRQHSIKWQNWTIKHGSQFLMLLFAADLLGLYTCFQVWIWTVTQSETATDEQCIETTSTHADGIVVGAKREVIATTQRRQFRAHVHLEMLKELVVLHTHTHKNSWS